MIQKKGGNHLKEATYLRWHEKGPQQKKADKEEQKKEWD